MRSLGSIGGDGELAADVVIVGYGPVGATAANFLGQLGVDVLVVERDADIYSRARAISTDEEVLRTWQWVGLADELKADMLGDREIDFVDAGGRSFLSFALKSRGNGHPPQMFIYQPALERTIRAGVERFANVRVLLGHEAGAVRHDADGVELEVTDLRARRRTTVRARYLLACDGGASPIRTQLGIGFEGRTYEDPWVVIDTKVKKEWPEVDRLRFHCDPDRPAVDCPTPLGHHRWEFPVLPGEDRDAVSSEESTWRMIARYGITPEHVEILRRAVYVHHVRFAARWRQGRVFLLGDAAHCMPPWIGQGMAAGVRDAGNLCWKLAAVLAGDAGDALLDSYEPERQPHVREVTAKAVFFGKVITERNRFKALLRNLAFTIAMRAPVVGPYLREGDWFPEPDYRAGLALPGGGTRPPQPFVRTPEHDRARLDDVLGLRWAVITRSAREAGAWEAVGAQVLVLGADLHDLDGALDAFMAQRQADALVLRPDHFVYAAVRASEALPAPPAVLNQTRKAISL